MPALNTFATQTGPIPLNELDSNFATPIRIGSTDVALGGTYATLTGLTLSSPTFTSPILGTPVSGNFSVGTFTWPTFNQNTTGSAATATTSTNTTNLLGGAANRIAYQTALNTTGFITAPTVSSTYLSWDGSSYTWTSGVGGVTNVTGASPIASTGGSTPAISISQATTSTNGYLSSADWNTFNSKGSGTVTSVSGTAPVSVATGTTTPVISMAAATTSVNGYLTSTDWNTFNAKYSTGGALGTPSSGTLTNCTGYTYANLTGTVPTWNQNTTGTSSNVTGVVAIANGGTGTTTALAVNVKVFGATGDGTTDDRAAIQSAIDSISSGVVIFPAGNYLIGNNGSGVGLTLKPNVSLISFESASVYLLAGANSIKLLNYVNPSSSTIVSNFIISGINLSSNSKTGCTGIYIDGNTTSARCSYIQISEMQLNGTFSNGIYLKYCANTYLSNLFVSLPAVGVTLDNCADSDLVNVKVQNGASYGFQVIGGGGAFDEGTRLSNCSTNGQGYGLYINGADWGICTGCSFTTAPSGAVLANGTNIHWKFTGCEFAVAGGSPASAGVNLSSGCTDFIFIGCVISLNTFGIVLRGSLHIVNGCSFEANSNVDLYLDSNSKAAVNGNIFTSTGVSQSVLENASNYTNVVGNINNGTISLSGANSASANNINY